MANPSSNIWLRYGDELVHAVAPAMLRFGRSSDNDISVADDPAMHRWQGRLEFSGGHWWLRNAGAKTPLHVQDLGSSSAVLLTPGQLACLTFPEAIITFTTIDARSYQLTVRHDAPQPGDAPGETQGGTLTQSQVVPLRGDHLLLVLALAEPQLRDPAGHPTLPSNREVARRFGWKLPGYNSKLDKICAKFHRAGVHGLRGSIATVANDRRARLVEHLITTGLVTAGDLELLAHYPANP